MLTDEELELLLEAFQLRMDTVSDKYFTLIGKHIAEIGTFSATDLHRIKELQRMGANLADIEREIAKITQLNVNAVQELLEDAARSAYGDYSAYGLDDIASNALVLRAVRAQAKQTMQAMANLSNTTVVSSTYRQAIDTAIAAVQSGVADYHSAVRSTIRAVTNEGLRVQYESGLTRRLDTAVRQNIVDGVKQITQAIAGEVGEQFGADGVEISAHMDCAEDHLAVQGRQYTLAEFEDLQTSLKRPIGEWNCRHFAFPVILGASEPAYSGEELADLRAQSAEKITIDGVTKTRYQWTQKQRELETKARYAKNEANVCKVTGDSAGRRMAQSKIDEINQAYIRISEAAKLPTKRERMAVAGFHQVKADPNLIFIAEDAKLKAASGLPKVLLDLPNETVKATVDVDLPIIRGVVPKGATAESITVLAGDGTSTPIRDLKRLYAMYPSVGDASAWQKKSGIVASDHFRYELHWYENNGKVPAGEIKTKGVK